MENKFGPTISMMVSDEQLRICSCKQDKAIFYCFQSCGDQIETYGAVYYCIDKAHCQCTLLKQIDLFCCLREQASYQREYCLMCAQSSHLFHGCITIAALAHELDKHHWAPLFEKISKLDEIATQKMESYLDVVNLIEDMYQTMIVQHHEPQSQPFFAKMYLDLKQMHSQAVKEFKPKIEELLNKKEVTELFGLRIFYHQFNRNYEALKSLEQFDPEVLYERYIEVFQYPFNKESLIGLRYQSFLLFKDFKKKFLNSLINKTNQAIPQDQINQELINSLFLEYFMIEEVLSFMNSQENKQAFIGQDVLQDVKKDREILNDEIATALSKFENEIDLDKKEIKQMNGNYERTNKLIKDNNEMLNMKISKLEQLFLKKIEEAFETKDSLYINGKQWKVLFGVSSSDTFEFHDEFWTSKSEKNAFAYRNQVHFSCTFKLKAFWEQQIEKILIYSESGKHVVLCLPFAGDSLLDYFESEQLYTLTYESGAQTPYELVSNQYGKDQLPNQWSINGTGNKYGQLQQQILRLSGVGQKLKENKQSAYNYNQSQSIGHQQKQVQMINHYGAIVCGL